MLKNTLKGYLVVFLLKQININIMESEHLDFLSPANETPRERNFEDVFAELNREDALIIEEHINNIPRVNFNFENCLKFMHKYLVDAVVNGNYVILEHCAHTCVIEVSDLAYGLWIANGAEYFKFYNSGSWGGTNNIESKFIFTRSQKEKAHKMVMNKISEIALTAKDILQQQIDLLTSKMNAL